MVVGAIAVAVWGRPRATADIDVTVGVDAAGLESVAEHAGPAGFTVDQQWLDWNPLLRGSQVRLESAEIVVDAMRPRDRHEEMAFERRRPISLDGHTIWFVAPDDLILMKLKAGRPRDFEDAMVVLVAQRDSMDEAHMTEWARRTGVSDELSYVLGEASPPL
jgi:predicted nucleotidyltransferase